MHPTFIFLLSSKHKKKIIIIKLQFICDDQKYSPFVLKTRNRFSLHSGRKRL